MQVQVSLLGIPPAEYRKIHGVDNWTEQAHVGQLVKMDNICLKSCSQKKQKNT